MQNEKGENVELYMPRRWYVNSGDAITYSDWTNRVIDAQDHASVMVIVSYFVNIIDQHRSPRP